MAAAAPAAGAPAGHTCLPLTVAGRRRLRRQRLRACRAAEAKRILELLIPPPISRELLLRVRAAFRAPPRVQHVTGVVTAIAPRAEYDLGLHRAVVEFETLVNRPRAGSGSVASDCHVPSPAMEFVLQEPRGGNRLRAGFGSVASYCHQQSLSGESKLQELCDGDLQLHDLCGGNRLRAGSGSVASDCHPTGLHCVCAPPGLGPPEDVHGAPVHPCAELPDNPLRDRLPNAEAVLRSELRAGMQGETRFPHWPSVSAIESAFKEYIDGVGFEEEQVGALLAACRGRECGGVEVGEGMADLFCRSFLNVLEQHLPESLQRCIEAVRMADSGWLD